MNKNNKEIKDITIKYNHQKLFNSKVFFKNFKCRRKWKYKFNDNTSRWISNNIFFKDCILL